ncbi:MAG: alpha/beta fold hydrolase [Polyangiaceae bacterium]
MRPQLIGALALVAACTDPSGPTGPGGAGGATSSGTGTQTVVSSAQSGTGGAPGLDWSACALGECATLDVPLDWSAPAGKHIPLFLKHVAAKKTSHGGLWLLAGGPGFSGASLEPALAFFQFYLPDLDIYLLDHRGTGLSAALSCAGLDVDFKTLDEAVAALQTCVAELEVGWGADLVQFNSTNAARDLAYAIDLAREPDAPVFLWGGSYGTRWGLRYLAVAPPGQAAGVILDGVVGESLDALGMDASVEATAHALFDACSAEALCASKLGPDAWSRVGELLDLVDAGHCPTSLGLDRSAYAMLLGNLTFLEAGRREAGPALVYRALRCDAADQLAIESVATALFSADGSDPRFSLPLNLQIVTSEMLDAAALPSQAELEASLAARWAIAGGAPFVRAAYDAFPHGASEFAGTYPMTATPVLLLAGGLDARTPAALAAEVNAGLPGSSHQLVTIPRGGHVVTFSSPLSSGRTCGALLVTQFVDHPGGFLDTSCVDAVRALDFGAPSIGSFLGVSDAFENP